MSIRPGPNTETLTEIHDYLFSWGRWFGAAVVPDGEDHVADRIGVTTAPFQVDAGNNTWGAWVQALGPDDTPTDVEATGFTAHRVLVTNVERTAVIHFIQISFGETPEAGLAAIHYAEKPFQPLTVQSDTLVLNMVTGHVPAGTKAWVRIWAVGQNTGIVDFYFGLTPVSHSV